MSLRLANRLCLLVAALALPCIASQAQELRGTLFTTPQQRDYLDHLRSEFLVRSQGSGFDIQEAEVPLIPAATPEPAPVYTLGGIMTRSDGSRTIWLNGRTVDEPELPDGMHIVANDGALTLRVNTLNGNIMIKPGQTLDTGNGQVRE